MPNTSLESARLYEGEIGVGERAPSERQSQILEVVRGFTREHGYPPSVREIGERVGLSSSSTVQSHLKALERCGLIRRDPTKPRALVSARRDDRPQGNVPEFGVIPIVGKVAAGVPITAAENLEGEYIVPADFARRPDTFMLRVTGDSMIEAAILDGDLIIVSPQENAENGEIVVAMLEDEVTVKRFYREHGRIRLQPENRTMEPIYASVVKILGRVTAVIRKL
ncbi:MAG TPA: transcriptional repressor LexA [Candidatus Baltobacteraceae bacterium]|jgi:repressor LexA|nr:transcriptional repressor LexA [Candidatus Baltobacteraceae bacterium]